MSLFTKENAAAFGRKGAAASNRRWKQPKEPAPLPPPITDDLAGIQRTKQQLAKLDEELDRALDKRDLKRAAALAGIKARLWPLAQPTAGALKPGRRGSPAPRQVLPIIPKGTYQGTDETVPDGNLYR